MSAPLIPREGSPVVRAIIVVSGSSVTAMILGFLKNALAAYYFGTSMAMDTYLVALLLPDVVWQLSRTGAFNFIPLFGAERQRSEDDAWRAAGNMLTFWLLLLAGILLLSIALAPAATTLLAPGFGLARRAEMLAFVRVLFLMSASLGAGRILGVILHAEQRFFTAGLAEIVLQVGSTLFLISLHRLGVGALVWAHAFGGCLHLLISAVGLLPERRRLKVGFDLSSGPIRRLMRLSLPVYVSDTTDKLNQMVMRAFGSLLPVGAVSSLQYAYFPIEGVHRMLALSLTSAFFPFLSLRFARRDQRRARASLSRAVVASTILFLPLSAVVWLLAEPIVILLFQRGSFDTSSTLLTASALRLFAPAIFALGLNELIGSSFHARQDTVTPMWAGLSRVICNIALCAALTPALGHRGLALAATLSLYVKLGQLAWSARQMFTPSERRRTLKPLGQVCLAVGAMLVVIFPITGFAYPPIWIKTHALRSICSLGTLCLGAYATALWVLARRQFILHVGIARRTLPWPRRPAPTRAAQPTTQANP